MAEHRNVLVHLVVRKKNAAGLPNYNALGVHVYIYARNK
jgi:hypothetical protein